MYYGEKLNAITHLVGAGLALNPSMTISRSRAFWATVSDNPTYLAGVERRCEALRRAGVPE